MGQCLAVYDGKTWVSIKGDRGDPGKSLAIKGSVADATALPATGAEGDLWIDSSTGDGHAWNAATNTWDNVGRLQGPAGPQGLKGDRGLTGAAGVDGVSATVRVGTMTTGAAGTSAAVTNTGTNTHAVLNFTIPQGAKGDTGDKGDTGTSATIAVGTVTDGASGTNAKVTNTGTPSAAVLNFTIPAGQVGPTGPQGPKGDTGAAGKDGTDGITPTIAVGTTTTGGAGSAATVTNSGTGNNYVLDFTIPAGSTGATGPAGKDGVTPTLSIGTVAAGTTPSVTIGGTAPAYTLSFTLQKGDKGDTGATGPAGADGKDGSGVTIKGTQNGGTWPPAGTHAAGDMWLIGSPVPAGAPAGAITGHGVVYDGAAWNDVGPIQGPAGPAGPAGTAGAQGPAGPSAVSTDANNAARLGTDSLIFVPTVTPPRAADSAPLPLASAAAIGSSTDYAREDHVHAYPTALQIGAAEAVHTHAAATITGLAPVAVSGQYADLTGKPAAYALPVATATVLGGVKIGSGISIDANGVISATSTGSTTVADATTTTKGIVRLAAAADLVSPGNTSAAVTAAQLVTATTGYAPIASPVFTGSATIPSGSATAPSLRFTGDDDTGLYSPANGQVYVTLNGTPQLMVTGTGVTVAGVLTAGGNAFPTTKGTAGQHLATDGAGKLTWVDAVSPSIATASVAGVVKVGSGLAVTGDGTLSVTFPTASTTQQGVVSLADAAAITAGTAGRVVDAAALKTATGSYVPLTGGVMTGQLTTPTLITTSGTQLSGNWYPQDKGIAGQFLRTNGFGILSWADGAAATINGGTAAAPGLPVAGDPDTGLFSAGSNTLSISAGAQERLRATATLLEVYGGADSRLAVSATTHQAVVGTAANRVLVTQSATSWEAAVVASSLTTAYMQFNGSQFAASSHSVVLESTQHGVSIRTGGTTRLTIDNTGTSTFTGQILANAIATANSVAYGFDSDPNTGIGRAGADTLTFVTAGTERVRVDATGKVAIGVAPAGSGSSLQVRGDVSIFPADRSTTQNFGVGDDGIVGWYRAKIAFIPSSAVHNVSQHIAFLNKDGDNGGDPLVERMRIKANGAVRFVPLSADPAGGETGDVYYNSTANKLRVFNGTSWIDLH